MKTIRKISKQYYLKQIMSSWLAFYMFFCFGLPLRVATAEVVMTSNPVGEITVTALNGGTTQDMTATNGAIGNFSDFDIAAGHMVTCVQGAPDNKALFKVNGDGTEIFGTFQSDGRIFLIDTAGIFIGDGAVINMTQLVASGLDMSEEAFTAVVNNASEKMVFSGGNGNVTVMGTLNASGTESLYLVGHSVFNNGDIVCPGGLVVMAAGDEVRLAQPGSNVIVAIPDLVADGDNVVENNGTVSGGEDGSVGKLVLAAGDVWSAAIANVEKVEIAATGSIEADDLDTINASAQAASDAVTEVMISSAGDIIIDDDVTAEAVGDGVNNAVASVTIDAGGNVQIISEDSATTTIKAKAYDGANNFAAVGLTAVGSVDILGPDRVEVYAQAYGGSFNPVLNEAVINIHAGNSITVIADDTGSDNAPAEIIASASNGQTNSATVDIEATEGGVDIIGSDEDTSNPTLIKAVAEYGIENFADVMIAAGGDVRLLAQDSKAKIEAKAQYGLDDSPAAINEAGIEITGANVTIKSDNSGSGDDNVAVMAYANDGGQNTASIAITATGTEIIEEDVVVGVEGGDVLIESEGYRGDNATVCALAEQGTTNTATIDITAAAGVEIVSDEEDATVKAQALNELDEDDLVDGAIAGLTNTATINITAADEVKIEAWDDSSADAAVEAVAKNIIDLDPEIPAMGDDMLTPELPLAIQDLTNTANISITGGSVGIKGLGDGAEAVVKTTAANQMDIDIENCESPVIVNLAITNLENSAAVTIHADGQEPGDIIVQGENGYSLVRAEAYNTLEVEHEGDNSDCPDCPLPLAKIDLTIDGLLNNATINITSDNGSVQVWANDAAANVEAEAYNDFNMDFDNEKTVSSLTFNNLTNTASVGITAGQNVDVLAEDGGEAGIIASASNYLDADDEVDEVTGDNIINDASVAIDAGGYVKVEADSGEAYIVAEAYNDGDIDIEGLQNITNATNTANVDILAGGNVEVIAKDGGQAQIIAQTSLGTDNTSNVTVNADGDVIVSSEGGYLHEWQELDTPGYYEVYVWYYCGYPTKCYTTLERQKWWELPFGYHHISHEYIDPTYIDHSSFTPSVASVEAIAENALNSNTAGVDITAGGNVEVIAEYGGQAFVSAYTGNALDSVNTSSINITAQDGFVLVHAIGGAESTEEIYTPSEASIEATAENAGTGEQIGTNSADITIVATDIPDEEQQDTLSDGDVGVIAEDGGKAEVEAIAKDGDENAAAVDITADDDVKVEAGWFSQAEITALAKDGLNNTADIDILAGGNVEVIAENGGEAAIEAIAKYADISNTAQIDILANNVLVLALNEGDAEISALAELEQLFEPSIDIQQLPDGLIETTNTAAVNIETFTVAVEEESPIEQQELELLQSDSIGDIVEDIIDAGGHVVVAAIGNSDAQIAAESYGAAENTASVGIDAQGSVIVASACESGAGINALAEDAAISNNASVNITANNVIAVAANYSDARIKARAAFTSEDAEETQNNANVEIRTFKTDIVLEEEPSDQPASDLLSMTDGLLNNPQLVEAILEGGHVVVGSLNGGDTQIEAVTYGSATNTSDVLVCAEGAVIVAALGIGESEGDTNAEIKALSHFGTTNNSSLGMGADLGLAVVALGHGSNAEISSTAMFGFENTASLIACTQGPLAVLAVNGGEAEISAEAVEGHITDAFVAVCAVDDILVIAGQPGMPGYEAGIKAEAESYGNSEDTEPSSANAQTVVVSHEGSVEVLACNGGEAEILAEAQGGHTNTANVGVAAAADLSPSDVAAPVPTDGDIIPTFIIDEFGPLPLSGNVIVQASGEGKAQILANAHDAYPIFVEIPGDDGGLELVPGQNTADTVICAPGEVRVLADESSDAKIKSWAGSWGEDESINTATTQVYASEVRVDVPDRRGNGITAWAVGSENGKVTVPDNDTITEDGRLTYCLTEDETVAVTDGSTLIIDTYANRTNCPTCPPCPCEEDGDGDGDGAAAAAAVVPPLLQVRFPEISGCPMLMDAAAIELGIPTETIQIGFAAVTSGAGSPGGFASGTSVAPNVQPCYACEALVSYAEILKDADGSHMAAMAQVFNTLAPADAPFTPEMSSAIASAFAENFDNPDMPQFAKALEYIEAFTGYVATLDDQMGSPVGDSAAFVMGKYGAPLTASNPNMTAYVQSQIAATQGI